MDLSNSGNPVFSLGNILVLLPLKKMENNYDKQQFYSSISTKAYSTDGIYYRPVDAGQRCY